MNNGVVVSFGSCFAPLSLANCVPQTAAATSTTIATTSITLTTVTKTLFHFLVLLFLFYLAITRILG